MNKQVVLNKKRQKIKTIKIKRKTKLKKTNKTR